MVVSGSLMGDSEHRPPEFWGVSAVENPLLPHQSLGSQASGHGYHTARAAHIRWHPQVHCWEGKLNSDLF